MEYDEINLRTKTTYADGNSKLVHLMLLAEMNFSLIKKVTKLKKSLI